jgi:hypothetical protein
MADIVTPYSVTLGATDYPAKYAGLLAYLEGYLNGLELLPPGTRNKIINGKAELAQRGTSFAAVADGAYTLDRWRFGNTSAAVVTISQQSDVPADNEFQNSLRVAVTFADATIAASDTCFISQRIEGYNVRDLIGRTFTLRFRARSSKTGVHCVAFRNSGLNRSAVAEYTVNAANTWETKSVTLTGGLITAGTWDWTNGTGLEVCFVLAAGSTFQTTAGAWQTGNFLDTANQVNCLDSNTNIFAITGVQLEVGSVATPFEHRTYGAELALAQRYAWLIGNTGAATVPFIGFQVGTTILDYQVSLPVTMRSAPTITASSGLAWNATGPTGNQLGSYDPTAIGWLTSTHASITTSWIGASDTRNGFLRLTGSGGAFGGASGRAAQLNMGSTAWYLFSSEL